MDFKNVRKRNIIIKITKCILNDKKLIDKKFSKEELKEKFYLKKSDLSNYIDLLFNTEKDKYTFKDDIKRQIESYIEENTIEKKKSNQLREEFKIKYNLLKSCFSGFKVDHETYMKEITQAIKVAKELHWIYLPIYSEEMIMNRGIIPEDNLEEYYDHFHAIEDLYFEVIGKGISYKSIEGDINLEQEISINIYTSRWSSSDIYTIRRTVEGWHLDFQMYSGDFEKDGEGRFFEALEHDSVFFPKEAVKHALNLLWNEADKTNMNIDELRHKFSQIAKWISEVEKVSRQYQPEWCNYF